VRVGLQEARFLLDRIAERELGEVAGGQRDGVAVIGHALDVVDLGYAREDVRLRDQQHVAVILEDRARTTLRTGLIAISVAVAITITITVPITIAVPIAVAITRVTIPVTISRVAITISVPGIAIPVSGIPVAITRIAVSITRISVPVAISVPIAGRVRVPITVTRGLESGAPITLIR
jgi:hypothetical protein